MNFLTPWANNQLLPQSLNVVDAMFSDGANPLLGGEEVLW